MSDVAHLALHRPGAPASAGQLIFETTLRKGGKSKEFLSLEKGWNTIPNKDRHEQPQFIKTKFLKKKMIEPSELDTSFDGRQHYPRFTEKIIKNRNVNQFRHMIKSGNINLPSIGWQVNLRAY